MTKKRLYLAAVNNRYGDQAFLPYAAGLMWGYASQQPGITDAYEMCGMLFAKESVDKAADRLVDPDVLALSSYIWNHEWNKALAREVKRRWPSCAILVGGVQVPEESPRALGECEAFDFAIYGEGEGAFADFLAEYVTNERVYSRVGSLVWRSWQRRPPETRDPEHPLIGDIRIIVNPRRAETPMEDIPSPYLLGLFDDIIAANPQVRFQALQETNRGCIARGTLIVTETGKVTIEDVQPGERVLGWDEERQRFSWNTVECSVQTGIKEVFRIKVDGAHVDATDDHPIYTRRGWVDAREIVEGDEVLLHLSDTVSKTESDSDVLERVWTSSANATSTRNGYAHTSREENRQMQRLSESTGSVPGSHAIEDVLGRVRKSSTRRQYCQTLETDHETASSTSVSDMREGHVKVAHGAQSVLEEVYFSENSIVEARRRQPHEARGSRSARLQGHDGALGRRYFCAHDEDVVRSGEESRDLAEGARKLEPETELLRGTRRGVLDDKRSAVSVHRGFSILGGTVRLGSVPQPGLHAYDQEGEESHSCSRSLLASRSGEGAGGVDGLRESGVELLHHLGRRRPGREDGAESGDFRWAEVTSIETAGTVEVFDLLNAVPHPNFFANGILVHNCPYSCTFCAWGAASLTKVRQFPMERIIAEYEWFAHNKIELLYNADANYGILKRDIALTEELVKTKHRHGYPQKFRAAYAKNSNDVVFQISKTLADAGMLKATTLALQSEDDGVLVNIKRKNIKHDKFAELSRRYEEAGIATYVELIVGLPGETYESFVAGIDRVLDAGQHDSLSIYLCMMLANTEMDKPEYRAEHGLETVNMRALLYHGTPEPGVPEEIQETVIGTKAMPRRMLARAVYYSWMVQALHSLGLTQHLARELREKHGILYSRLYTHLLAWAVDGEGRDSQLGYAMHAATEWWGAACHGESWPTVDDRFGHVMWPPEELLFLNLAVPRVNKVFYDEMEDALGADGSPWTDATVAGIATLVEQQRALFIPPEPGKLVEYAREAVWYNRKGSSGLRVRKEVRVPDAAQR